MGVLDKYRNEDGFFNLEMLERDIGPEKFREEMSKLIFKGRRQRYVGRCAKGFRRNREGHCVKNGEKSPKRK